IPTWNRADSLAVAIQSTLNQTYPVLEVLVCDDGSTDHSRSVVNGFADARVKWISGEASGGPAKPRNRGIGLSQGKWLAFLDSDDSWYPEKLSRQLEYAIKKNLRAVCTNADRHVASKATEIFHKPERIAKANIDDRLPFEKLVNVNYVVCSTALVHRDLVALAGGFPEAADLRAVEDYALWLRVAAYAPFGYLNTPLASYSDDPLQSIRRDDDTERIQQQKIRAALGNLLEWNKQTRTLSAEQVSLVRKRILTSRTSPLLRLYGRFRRKLDSLLRF
ncbi:glycosyltransferase family 2 protein, partial [Persicitalea sp.]|uniref:glycosyltransferase family 2 protein n=1 Tax=Persicitalea sp. TaxID=3100273 RepID=UPI003593D93F